MLSRSLGLWSGTARETGSTSTDDVDGTIVNNKLIDSSNGVVSTLNLDVITGTFTDSTAQRFTINGQRTL